MCNASHVNSTIKTSHNWVFVFVCLFVRERVYGCVKVISGNTITNSINHLTPMFIIFTMNFLIFLLASFPPWNVLSEANIRRKKKKTYRTLECFEYIFYLFCASLLWPHFPTKFIVVHICLLSHSSDNPCLSPINFCLCPYFMPSSHQSISRKTNRQFIESDICEEKDGCV